MNESGQKGSITDEDFMIHVLNNLSKDYDVILNELNNHVTVPMDDALTINMICEKRKNRKRKSFGHVQQTI